MPLNLRTRGLNQLAVVHTGRARGHARHAAEASVEVPHPLRRNLRLAFRCKFHQQDAPARRVHLLVPQNVRRAGGQTEAAVHALVDDFLRRRMMFVEGAKGCSHGRTETRAELTITERCVAGKFSTWKAKEILAGAPRWL